MDTKTSILYVDDEPFNLLIFQINFQKEFNVLLARSGESGLELLRKHEDVALVITDIRMPGMSGIAFAEKVKQINQKVPCFVLTAFDQLPELKQAIMNKKVDHLFSKPLDISVVEHKIRQQLGV